MQTLNFITCHMCTIESQVCHIESSCSDCQRAGTASHKVTVAWVDYSQLKVSMRSSRDWEISSVYVFTTTSWILQINFVKNTSESTQWATQLSQPQQSVASCHWLINWSIYLCQRYWNDSKYQTCIVAYHCCTRVNCTFQPTHQPDFDRHQMQPPPCWPVYSKRVFSGQAVAEQGHLVQTKHKLPIMHGNCNSGQTLLRTKRHKIAYHQ